MLKLMPKNPSNPLSPLTVSRSFAVKWTHCFVEVSELIQVVFLLLNYFLLASLPPRLLMPLNCKRKSGLLQNHTSMNGSWVLDQICFYWLWSARTNTSPCTHILCLRSSTHPQVVLPTATQVLLGEQKTFISSFST